ncbi:hypothetical protein ARMSODRAFT_1002944 [Armillaria solidipes]|uniref:Uncharacterized protein n=1 Tax=Armillaria solidipes TaxID=1076256 RepID=A0A2H3BQ46_9AGAR|nr:hypothetical protein ARMSODRAFT_1002944 [Armillaria solidipes]
MTTEWLKETIFLVLCSLQCAYLISMLDEMNIAKVRNRRSSSQFWTAAWTNLVGKPFPSCESTSQVNPDLFIYENAYGEASTFPEPFMGMEVVPMRRHLNPSSDLPSRSVVLPCRFSSVEVAGTYEDAYRYRAVWEIKCKLARVMADAEYVQYRRTLVEEMPTWHDEFGRLFLPRSSRTFGMEKAVGLQMCIKTPFLERRV